MNQCYECGEWFGDHKFNKLVGMCYPCEGTALNELFEIVGSGEVDLLVDMSNEHQLRKENKP